MLRKHNNGNGDKLEKVLKQIHPSLAVLLLTLILLFGPQILAHPIIIGLLAIPIVIQAYFNSMLAY